MPIENDGCDPCPPECSRLAFDRVTVSHLLKGGSRVMWELADTFTDPAPHEFQLEVGRTAGQDADDWEAVGLPIDDTFYAIDDEQRLYGKTNWTHYRVRLTTSVGEYVSPAVNLLGTLGHRDWRLAEDIVRRIRLQLQYGAQEGYLLKRRIVGETCSCVDPALGESRNPQCELCYGTGLRCGYLYPMGCIWADLDPRLHRTHTEGGLQLGTINRVVVRTKMLAVAPLFQYDVWVARRTDDRYYIHSVQHRAEMRGVPLVADVEMRLAPVSDPIYSIVIPEQVVTSI